MQLREKKFRNARDANKSAAAHFAPDSAAPVSEIVESYQLQTTPSRSYLLSIFGNECLSLTRLKHKIILTLIADTICV